MPKHLDVGPADELLDVALKAIANGTTFAVIIDRPRTLKVIHTSHTNGETKIVVKDEETGEFITLYIPRGKDARARADVPSSPTA